MTFLLTVSLYLEKRESVNIQYYFQEEEEKETGREKKKTSIEVNFGELSEL